MNSADAGTPCMLMRGGTSKGAYFLKQDLPQDENERDNFLLRVMGSPDDRQIDGIGGAHPLTSKVAVVSPSETPGYDVDYLFLQVYVDQPLVSSQQNCGNILAGIGPFAIERGLVEAGQETTDVRIRMVNTNGTAVATIETPGGRVKYDGQTEISGVPGVAAAIVINFEESPDGDLASSALFPTGNVIEEIDGVQVTCVDNGMPVVVMSAADLGVTGTETPTELEGNAELRSKLESIRLVAGERMGFGDVTDKSIPKLTMVSPAASGGAINTRTFIPHRCHTSIGVLGGASVAVAAATPGSAAEKFLSSDHAGVRYRVEHPTGFLEVEIELNLDGELPVVKRTGVVRTARKLFDGAVFPRLGY